MAASPQSSRREEPREDERDDHPRDLQRELRPGLPGEAAADTRADRVRQVVGAPVQEAASQNVSACPARDHDRTARNVV